MKRSIALSRGCGAGFAAFNPARNIANAGGGPLEEFPGHAAAEGAASESASGGNAEWIGAVHGVAQR